jgi:hypothetical protein
MTEEGSNAHVTFFGSDVSNKDAWKSRHRHHDGPVGGAIILAGGVILLLNTLGVIPWAFWSQIAQFWPILLILVGVQIVLGSSFAARLLILILTLGAIGFVVVFALYKLNSPLLRYAPTTLIEAAQQFNSRVNPTTLP